MLHGTKEDIVDSIQAEGLDSRLSESDAMFGPGTYFTESSTKADQYAGRVYGDVGMQTNCGFLDLGNLH